MTGTAETEATEFNEIYGLSVMIIPTNKPCLRDDHNDVVFKTRQEKLLRSSAILRRRTRKGQPVLIGTASVEASGP